MRLRVGSKLSIVRDKDTYLPYMVYDIDELYYHLIYISDTYISAERFIKISRERFRAYCKKIKIDDSSLVEKNNVLEPFPLERVL